jgi:hypothetical protein
VRWRIFPVRPTFLVVPTYYEDGRWHSCARRATEKKLWSRREAWFHAWIDHRTSCVGEREEAA